MTLSFDAPFLFSGIMLLLGSGACFVLHLPYFQLRITSDGRTSQAGDGNDVEASSLTSRPSRGSFLARSAVENGPAAEAVVPVTKPERLDDDSKVGSQEEMV